MTKKVNIIAEYDTSMGHILTVNSDQVYKIGQSIENNGKRYLIKGFPIANNAKPNVVDMIVTRIP